MKKTLLFIGSMAILSLLAGCELETSDNGALDGYWHLEQVDTLATQSSADYSTRRIFWCFQFKLLQLSNLEDNTIVYRFERDDDLLKLDTPCMFDHTDGDTLVTDVEVLRPYGVNALSEDFRIVSLKRERMAVESPLLRLHFRKY